MDYKAIEVKNEDGVYVVTLNRPKALNALNKEMIADLNHFMDAALGFKDLKGIVLTGAGEKAFVAGADISEFTDLGEGGMAELVGPGNRAFDKMERFPKPVIAAVNGFALGGGCEVAMACHMRVAGPSAKFGTPEVNLGLVPGYGGTQRLIQLIGKGKATELLMTGDMIGADEAKTLGLANHVVEAGAEVEKAKSIILKIAKKAPLAIAKVVETVNAYFDKDADGFKVETAAFGDLGNSSDFVEGATAFLEKRKANFTGS